MTVIAKASAPVTKATSPAAAASLLQHDQLPETEQTYLFTPENNPGNPPGQIEMGTRTGAAAARTRERAGIANFSFDLPVADLPGRNLDASVGITYNSRVWTKSIVSGGGSRFTYDVEGGWFAPGFNFSLGYLDINYPPNLAPVPYALTDPDGTRHQLAPVTQGGVTYYETTDGTFIRVDGYTATFPDGTKIRYFTEGAAGSPARHFPTSITDRHGNMIQMVYKDVHGRLDYIRDTLSRYIRFHYDTTPEQKLVAVTVPGYNSAPNSQTSDPSLDRQTIRFYYETLNLQYQNRFDGQITVPNNGSLKVLRYVYFPATKTGYRYDYSTQYGMIYRITSLRGMQVSSNALNATGTVDNEGQWAAWTKYNYPGTDTEPPAPTLTDMPKYNKRFDEWQGRAGGGAAPQTLFNFAEDATNSRRTVTVISPDGGVVNETVSNLKPGQWDDGLIIETIVKSGGGQVMSKNALTWEEGPASAGGRRNPRVKKVEATNEANQTKATVYEYVDLNNNPCQYNNVCQVKEYDFAPAGQLGTLLRNTVTTYETGTNYINNRLLHLVKSVKVITGVQTVSRTEYKYDTLTLQTYTNANIGEMFDPSYNPATGNPQTYCEPSCSGPRLECCWTIPGYEPATGYRGNVTEVKRFADPSNDNDPLASVTTMKYDIAGNPAEATLDCCQLRKWIYTSANKYAYPMEVKEGANNELTTKATYDFNTGLTETSTDENEQVTDYEYEPDTLRQKKIIYPNGGHVLTEYSDKLITNPNDLVPGFVRTTTTLTAANSVQSYSYADGRGLPLRTAAETPDGWSVAAVEHDNLGRMKKSYNPFYAATPNGAIPAQTKYTEVVNYDALGRATQVKLQDETSVYSYFNEAAVTYTYTDTDNQTQITRTGTASRVKDQADKERRQIADALGRIIRVDEPTSAGLGTLTAPNQPTHYYYDASDNLTRVAQTEGAATQERRFKYDGLSRLTHEKQVEATPKLDDNGVWQTTGGLWTKVLKYNNKSLLIEGVDARGVKTKFSYDGANRVKTVVFENETGGATTPNITYTYDQARTGFFNKGALTRVETAAVGEQTPATATEFDYDLMGRVKKQRQSIGAQVYNLEYAYNLVGQLVSTTYPSGRIVSTGYDNKGRLASVADGSRTYLNNLQYQGKGNSLSSLAFGNATTQTLTFNDRLQMTGQELKRGAEVLQKYDYGYGLIDGSGNLDVSKNNGQLAKIESHIGANKQWTKKFSYDSIGRLSKEEEFRGDNANLVYRNNFDYDRFGNLYRKQASNPNSLSTNWIEETDISQTTNRFTANTTYDDAGNVTRDTKFRSRDFRYDANGRTVWTKLADGSGMEATSVYDAAGLRVAEKVNDVWRFLIYDAFGKMIAEYGGMSQSDEGGVKYVLSDWQGSTRAVVSNAGYILSRTDYQAFGEEIATSVGQRTAAQGFGAANSLRQKYGLTERDEASGLDHTWFRKNENKAGRWTSPDPYNGSININNPQSFNRYSYVENDPVNFIDPSGLVIIANFQVCGMVTLEFWNGEAWDSIIGWGCWTVTAFFPSPSPGVGGGVVNEKADEDAYKNCEKDAFIDFSEAQTTAYKNWEKAMIRNGFVASSITLLSAYKTKHPLPILVTAGATFTAAVIFATNDYHDENRKAEEKLKKALDNCKRDNPRGFSLTKAKRGLAIERYNKDLKDLEKNNPLIRIYTGGGILNLP
jgi:RHS repeat-associated protein